MGGLTGADVGSVFTARRGVERTLFFTTIILSALFFIIVLTILIISREFCNRMGKAVHPRGCSAG